MDATCAPESPRGLLADGFLSYGFRPFFLMSAVYAVVVMAGLLIWTGVHQAGGAVVSMTIAMAPHVWHAHEMVFGFAVGVVSGFMLTAVPSWTGTRPLNGGPLAVLCVVWLAGRVAVTVSDLLPAVAVAVLDLAFLPLLTAQILSLLGGRGSRRNLVFLPILAVVFAGNLLFHLEQLALFDDGIAVGLRLALGGLALLIAIIGGRVVPAFTTNALRRMGEQRLPVVSKPLTIVAVGSVAALLFADVAAPDDPLTGWIALAAALANAARLARWRGLRTVVDPIVFVLHVAFAWLVAALALKGLAILGFGIGPQTAVHALTAGAIGTMTLAIMGRAALGHTGRAIVAGPALKIAYLLVSAGALIRVIVPSVFPELYGPGILLSGVVWASAFAVFAVTFLPVLTQPRVRPPD